MASGIEVAEFGFFEGESANDADADEAFLHAVGELAEGLLVGGGTREDDASVQSGDEDEQGEGSECGEGESRGDLDHDGQGADESEEGIDDIENTEAEQQAHLSEVIGGAAHDFAGGDFLKEAESQAMQVVDEVGANLVFGVSAGMKDGDSGQDANSGGDGHENENEDDSTNCERFVGGDSGIDTCFEQAIAQAHECLQDGEQNRSCQVGRELFSELGAEGVVVAHGLGHGGLGLVTVLHIYLPERVSKLFFRWEDCREGRSLESTTASSCSASNRVERSPSITRALPRVSSSATMPIFPTKGPERTRTCAPLSRVPPAVNAGWGCGGGGRSAVLGFGVNSRARGTGRLWGIAAGGVGVAVRGVAGEGGVAAVEDVDLNRVARVGRERLESYSTRSRVISRDCSIRTCRRRSDSCCCIRSASARCAAACERWICMASSDRPSSDTSSCCCQARI